MSGAGHAAKKGKRKIVPRSEKTFNFPRVGAGTARKRKRFAISSNSRGTFQFFQAWQNFLTVFISYNLHSLFRFLASSSHLLKSTLESYKDFPSTFGPLRKSLDQVR